MALAAVLLAPLAVGGCASPASAPETSASPRLHHLLDLADARAPLAELEPFLRDAEPSVRAHATRAAAMTAPLECGPALRMAVRDPDPLVRRWAALSMGLTDDPSLAADCLALVRSADTDASVLATAAFAAVRLAGDRAWNEGEFAALFSHEVPIVRRAAFRSLAGAVRTWASKPEVPPRWLLEALRPEETDATIKASAALALRRLPHGPAAEDVHDLLVFAMHEDESHDVRAACALALDRSRPDHETTLAQAVAKDSRARARAWMAAALGQPGSTVGRDALIALLGSDGDHGVRAAAAGSLGRREAGADRAVAAALVNAARHDGARLVRVEALAALHGAEGAEAAAALRDAVRSTDPFHRAAAAGSALDGAQLDLLLHDTVARVRAAAVAEAGARGRAGLGRCLDALDDEDPVVAAVAASALGEMGAKETRGALRTVLARHPSPTTAPDRDGDIRASALEALGRLDPEGAREDAASYLGDPDALVRAAAVAILAPQVEVPEGATPPPSPPTPSGPRIEPFPDRRALRVSAPRRVRFRTNRGSFVVETFPFDAPVSVARFLARVKDGGYDGTLFHRIVPNFVIQGGDPRGDGWGNGGAPWRAEFSGLPYLRGTLGVPRSSEPDSSGCQLFFCHGSTPHLDQRYTVTGRIVEGVDIVDRIDLGDVILEARVE